MPIKADTKRTLREFTVALGYTILSDDAEENHEKWELECPTCEDSFHIRVDSIKQYCYNGKCIVCPQCKHKTKIEKFEEANNVTRGFESVTCNDCTLHYHYKGDFFRPFHCYCKLAGRRQDAALYRELAPFYNPSFLSKERVYVGNHRCDIAINTEEVAEDEDGDDYLRDIVIYIEVDDAGHFSGQRAERDKELVASFLENRRDYQFLLRIDASLVTEDGVAALAERINEWRPEKPVTLAYSGERFRYHRLELDEEDFELLP